MSVVTGSRTSSKIEIDEVKNPQRIPEIPVFSPEWDDFKDFGSCISLIECFGAHHIGLCKVVPPEGWEPRSNGYYDINDMIVEKPICQTAYGGRGIYLQNIIEKKSMLFKDFRDLALSVTHCTPKHRDLDHLEKKYWSSIGFARPLYGANVNGTLMDPNQSVWNVANLDSILSKVFEEEGLKIPGVNTPYLYYGMWRSTFPWHVEDVELYSINYLHYGYPKCWYVIPPPYARKFESFVFEYFRSEFLSCRCFLRHKCVLINPSVLWKAGIPTKKIIQKPGEFMITFPYAYHAGFNMGLNIAESTNFAFPRWIEYGKKAKICTCWNDTVKICMDPFVQRYQPELFYDWKNGRDTVPHPLDQYTTQVVTPVISNKNRKAEKIGEHSPLWLASFKKQNEVEKVAEDFSKSDISEISDSPNGIHVGDLNLIDLRYSSKMFRNAKLPYHIATINSLSSLWCGEPFNKESEEQFNLIIGSFKPHCSICSFLWTPQHFAKILSRFPPKIKLPEFGEPYIPEVAYSTFYDSGLCLNLPTNVKSPIIQCSRCHLTVHARCYGIESNLIQSSSNDSIDKSTKLWCCDSCLVPVKPSCVFCYLRGGAMKSLVNPSNNFTGRPYWAHIVCALASPDCHFVDIDKRSAFVSTASINKALLCEKQTFYDNNQEIFDHLGEQKSQIDFNNSLNQINHVEQFKLKKKRKSSSATTSIHHNKRGIIKSSYSLKWNKESDCSTEYEISSQPGTSNYKFPVRDRSRKLVTSSADYGLSVMPNYDPVNKFDDFLTLHTVCLVCHLPGRGYLPLPKCWHPNCSVHFHITCAQMAGVMIGTDVYPRFFYIACENHPTDYYQHNLHDLEPVFPGDEIMVRESFNLPEFIPAVAVRPVTPLYCRIAFSDGTFSSDTPPEYLTNIDWAKNGPPAKGTTVKVLWDDNQEYVGTFEGTTPEEWEVEYESGECVILSREQFYLKPKDEVTGNDLKRLSENLPFRSPRSFQHCRPVVPNSTKSMHK